jgi:hypothetical protein
MKKLSVTKIPILMQVIAMALAFAFAITLSSCKQTDSPSMATNNISAYLHPLYVEDIFDNLNFHDNTSEKAQQMFQNLDISDIKDQIQQNNFTEGNFANNSIIPISSIPQHGIELYGYNNQDYPGFGLFLYAKDTQNITSLPIQYMSNTKLLPNVGMIENDLIAIILHVGSGSGVSVDELCLCQINENGDLVPYFIGLHDMVSTLNKSLQMTLNQSSNNVSILWNNSEIGLDSYEFFGIEKSHLSQAIPKSFFVGDILNYTIEENHLQIHFQPTLYTENRVGFGYFENISSITSEISFEFDENGILNDFSTHGAGILFDSPNG